MKNAKTSENINVSTPNSFEWPPGIVCKTRCTDKIEKTNAVCIKKEFVLLVIFIDDITIRIYFCLRIM